MCCISLTQALSNPFHVSVGIFQFIFAKLCFVWFKAFVIRLLCHSVLKIRNSDLDQQLVLIFA